MRYLNLNTEHEVFEPEKLEVFGLELLTMRYLNLKYWT